MPQRDRCRQMLLARLASVAPWSERRYLWKPRSSEVLRGGGVVPRVFGIPLFEVLAAPAAQPAILAEAPSASGTAARDRTRIERATAVRSWRRTSAPLFVPVRRSFSCETTAMRTACRHAQHKLRSRACSRMTPIWARWEERSALAVVVARKASRPGKRVSMHRIKPCWSMLVATCLKRNFRLLGMCSASEESPSDPLPLRSLVLSQAPLVYSPLP